VRWLVEPGQKVDRGQPLVEVETDKATMEVESVVGGVLAEVRAEAGAEVSVGQVIAVLNVDNATPAAIPAPLVRPSDALSSASPPPASTGESPKPLARPAGMFARNRAAAAAPLKTNRGIPLSVAQRTAARRLQESKQTVPHFYLQSSANVSAIIIHRNAAESARPAWDAFFVLAVARAIAKFDRFRCRFDGEHLLPAETDAIGVAIDHEGELYVMPIASPATKTVEQISDDIRRSVEQLRSGAPEARRIRPALITISNLGAANVESFVPIINPPEAAILGIGRAAPTPVARDDGRVGVEPRVTLTLSVDHRVASGRYAGEFLGEIVRQLESFGGNVS
jgi:pyruvate dehydrogenase E2 component (dihydrolipoamide acetyltransferase)